MGLKVKNFNSGGTRWGIRVRVAVAIKDQHELLSTHLSAMYQQNALATTKKLMDLLADSQALREIRLIASLATYCDTMPCL